MTLILLLASELDVHMSCDFKLTEARSGAALDFNAHKLVSVGRSDFQALVGVTGLATLDRQPIGQWLAEQAGALPWDASLNDLFTALRSASIQLARVPSQARPYRFLTFVVGAIQGSQSVVATVSNYERIRGVHYSGGSVPADLELDVLRPSKPFMLVAGSGRGFVRKEERVSLERSLRGRVEQGLLRDRMAAVNEHVARRTPTVSRGCQVASQFARGNRGATQRYLIDQTAPIGSLEMEKLLHGSGLVLKSDTGEPLQMVASTSVVSVSSESGFREQFKLSPNDPELWNNYGAFLSAKGEIKLARAAYETAIRHNPDFYLACRNLGALLWEAYGDQVEGERLIRHALREPDDNHRRDTLSLLAELTSSNARDHDAAAAMFLEAMEGDCLTLVSTRFAEFALRQRPDLLELATHAMNATERTDPHFPRAVAVRASILRIKGKSLDGRSLLDRSLAVSPDSVELLAGRIGVDLETRNCTSSRRYLDRLRKAADATENMITHYSALQLLCEDGDITRVLRLLRRVGDGNALVNSAIISHSRGELSAATEHLGLVEERQLSLHALMEKRAVESLATAATPRVALRGLQADFTDAQLRTFDSVMFKLAAGHAQANPDRSRAMLELVEMLHRT